MKNKKGGFWGEFREFITRGNVIDLAVGVIIGGAFSAITSSLVNDVMMPLVGLLLGGVNFTSWSFTLGPIFANAEPSVIHIGSFIQAVVYFLILAFVIFLFIRGVNRAHAMAQAKHDSKAAAEPPAPAAPPAPTEAELLAKILQVLEAGDRN